MSLRIVFMGTPVFGIPALTALAERHQVVGVYCQPPQAAGRGMKLRRAATHDWAEAHNIPVFTPKSLRKQPAQDELAALQPDVCVVASYGLILPQAVLDIPRFGCINIHPSLLPRWRGAAPIQRTVEAGDAETGVCIMQMEAGLDTGPVYARTTMPVTAGTTASQLHDTLAQQGADLLLAVLDDVAAGRASATPQGEAGVTYAEKITKEEGELDFTQDAAILDRKVRGFTPWPATWFISRGVRIKVHSAVLGPVSATAHAPGILLDADGLVACGGGTSLRLQSVQREGKAATDAAAFLRGFDVAVGDTL